MPVKPIPEGFHTVTPYFSVKGAGALLEFIKQAFDAKEIFRHDLSDGTVSHAQAQIGDSFVMLADAPGDRAPLPCMVYLYLEDVDVTYHQALAAGATSLREPTDEFYGDRSAGVQDHWGNQWWMATHIEDVSNEELVRRAKESRG